MKRNTNKTTIAARILAIVLAALMILSAATYLIYALLGLL